MVDPAHIRALCDQIHDALTISEHPPSPKGGQNGTTSTSRPPMPTAVLDAKLDLKQKLTSWAQLIGEEHEVVINCDDNSYSIAGWIYTKADWLAGHPAADDFCDEIEAAVKALRRPYANKDDRLLCTVWQGIPIYAWPWEKTITLPDGRVEPVHTLREELRRLTMDKILAPADVTAVLRDIFDMDVPADSIRKAARRGTLKAYDKSFKVEEVIQRFATRPKAVAI